MTTTNILYNTICYHLYIPVIYNKGTKYEKKSYDFLEKYTNLNDEEVEREVKRLNSTVADRVYYSVKQERPY